MDKLSYHVKKKRKEKPKSQILIINPGKEIIISQENYK